MTNASEEDYSAALVLSFVQYAEIKANTGGVYFGLISGFVSASRTKGEKDVAELRGPGGDQLNPPRKDNKSSKCLV